MYVLPFSPRNRAPNGIDRLCTEYGACAVKIFLRTFKWIPAHFSEPSRQFAYLAGLPASASSTVEAWHSNNYNATDFLLSRSSQSALC